MCVCVCVRIVYTVITGESISINLHMVKLYFTKTHSLQCFVASAT